MKFRNSERTHQFTRRAIFCVSVGTGAGLLCYWFFLYYDIAILGWNLGLFFAPIVAGYVETVLANRLLGENIGAISAFILFIDTVIYGFILKNPTLGLNFITAGSIIVILQAAFPTLINYILLVVVGGALSHFFTTIKNFENKIIDKIKSKNPVKWETDDEEVQKEYLKVFDESKSNMELNSMGFYFITSTDMPDKKYDIIGHYHSEVFIERDTSLIKLNPENAEKRSLVNIKESKDECLTKLVKKIQSAGGNGVMDLTVNYNLIGMGGDSIQITALGIGVNIH